MSIEPAGSLDSSDASSAERARRRLVVEKGFYVHPVTGTDGGGAPARLTPIRSR